MITPWNAQSKKQHCLKALPTIQYTVTALRCQRPEKEHRCSCTHKCQPNWVPALQHEQCNDQALGSKFPEGLKSLPFCENPQIPKELHGLAAKPEYFLLCGTLLAWPGASTKVTWCHSCYSNVLKCSYSHIHFPYTLLLWLFLCPLQKFNAK